MMKSEAGIVVAVALMMTHIGVDTYISDAKLSMAQIKTV